MMAVEGYYDGVEIKPLEKMIVQKNQKVIITITNEFIHPERMTKTAGMRGALSKYANPALREKEKGAWERAVVDNYGNA